MAMKLGEKIGEAIGAFVYDMPNRSVIVKVKVKLSILSPIKPGMYIGSKASGASWVDFRYDKLPMCCFICGIMGHNKDH